jgi:hypothetical protein
VREKLARGQRVRITKPSAAAGETGIIVKVTRGHRLYKVWLDEPATFPEYRRGVRRGSWTAYVLNLSQWEVEPLGLADDDGPEIVVRPPEWTTEDAFCKAMRSGELRVYNRRTHWVLATRRGAQAAHRAASAYRSKAQHDERRARRRAVDA